MTWSHWHIFIEYELRIFWESYLHGQDRWKIFDRCTKHRGRVDCHLVLDFVLYCCTLVLVVFLACLLTVLKDLYMRSICTKALGLATIQSLSSWIIRRANMSFSIHEDCNFRSASNYFCSMTVQRIHLQYYRHWSFTHTLTIMAMQQTKMANQTTIFDYVDVIKKLWCFRNNVSNTKTQNSIPSLRSHHGFRWSCRPPDQLAPYNHIEN